MVLISMTSNYQYFCRYESCECEEPEPVCCEEPEVCEERM